MRVNLTILFVTAGVGILSTIVEKVLSKGGNETGAYITGLVSLLIGFGIVIAILKMVIDSAMSVFIPM